jgi:hypothetical protein
MEAMLPDNTTKCCPHMAHLREIGFSGLKDIMRVAEALKTDTDTFPDDLKPYGEAMTKIFMEALIKNYAEWLQLISELGLQEIAREARPPEHQTEPDSRQRSGSDGI